MRPTDVGAFISQSAADIPLPPLPRIKTCDAPRQAATKRDFAHGDPIPRVKRTNRLPDCGTRADRSTMACVREEPLAPMPTADRPSCGMPALRVANSEEFAQTNDLGTASGPTLVSTAVDHRRERRDIGPRLIRQRPTGRQMAFVASRSRIVGSEEARRAKPVMELSHVGGAGQDVVARIIGIGTEPVASAQVAPRSSA